MKFSYLLQQMCSLRYSFIGGHSQKFVGFIFFLGGGYKFSIVLGYTFFRSTQFRNRLTSFLIKMRHQSKWNIILFSTQSSKIIWKAADPRHSMRPTCVLNLRVYWGKQNCCSVLNEKDNILRIKTIGPNKNIYRTVLGGIYTNIHPSLRLWYSLHRVAHKNDPKQIVYNN